MSETKCPTEAELLTFVDSDASPEQLERLERHLELCSACAKQVLSLTALVKDLRAPLERESVDVTQHVASVMKRLDQPVTSRGARKPMAWAATLAVAAAALLTLTQLRGGSDAARGELAARGAHGEPSLSRDVGVQLYAGGRELTALASGARISRSTPLTAGLRNLASERAYLLLFAVDSAHQVHWITPEYTAVGQNPEATPVAPSASERLLPSAAVFDDLAPGALRVMAVLSRAPLHLADVEALPPSELTAERLLARLPRTEVRQFMLEVE
jgi:hypothetical protein